MKLAIRFGQIILATAWLMVASTVWTNIHAANTITLNAANGSKTIDMDDPEERAKFLAVYGRAKGVPVCKDKADYIVKLMKERDAGITKEEHLQHVRDNYEKTKLDPQGAVPWHVYIDFGRMVRDVHRSSGRDASRYNRTDADELWGHEFTGCISAR